MQIATHYNIEAMLTGNGEFSTSDAAAIDKKFQALLQDERDAAAELEAITRNGVKSFWSWKIDELKKRITAKVMGALNLTAEKIAAMSDKDRLVVEAKILRMVEDQLRIAIEEEMKKQQKQQLSASASRQSLLQFTQGV